MSNPQPAWFVQIWIVIFQPAYGAHAQSYAFVLNQLKADKQTNLDCLSEPTIPIGMVALPAHHIEVRPRFVTTAREGLEKDMVVRKMLREEKVSARCRSTVRIHTCCEFLLFV